MMALRDKRSILGVDPTPRGLAFVSFEEGEVRDWGTRLFHDPDDATPDLDVLLDLCGTDVLVLEDPQAPGSIRRARMRVLLLQLAAHAHRCGVEVILVPREAVAEAWRMKAAPHKYAIAREIGTYFEELEPLVPKTRKHYDAEPSRIHLFDAASLAVHAFGVEERRVAA
ncbi:MAG TPA: hypothetical protein VGJ81_05380 [Thermoanaerobaculia bacterium]|jgi:hypothetical protein